MAFILEEMPTSVSCHPTSNLVTAGCIDGSVITFSYNNVSEDDCRTLAFVTCWKKKQRAAVRKIRFSSHGDKVFSVTRNKTLTLWDTGTGKKLTVIRNVSGTAARPYCMHVLSEHQLAVGDEAGVARVLDWRSKNDPPFAAQIEDSETDQYLTGLASDAHGRLLLATCGDRTLLAMDLRKKKVVVKSEPMHDELLSLCAVKNNTKLFCGSADGYLEEFNWNEWGNIVERFDTGHQDTVDSLCKLDEHLLASASSNGTIRLHHVFPNKTLKTIGQHDDLSAVEELALSHPSGSGQSWLVSCGQDSKVKLWDAESLTRNAPKTKSGSTLKKLTKAKDSFFSDLSENNGKATLAESSESSDDDSDSDDSCNDQ